MCARAAIPGGWSKPYLAPAPKGPRAAEPFVPAPRRGSPAQDSLLPLFKNKAMQCRWSARLHAEEADHLRRSLASSAQWHKSKTTAPFVHRMTQRIQSRHCEACFVPDRGFARYMLPRSHRRLCEMLTYVSVKLKCHHPQSLHVPFECTANGVYAPHRSYTRRPEQRD